jgi:SSS family solute:Na+ symporter
MNHVIKLSGLDLSIIGIYVTILIGVAVWATYGKKNKSGGTIFLANKSLGWFAIGLTMWGTNVGPSMLLANASSGYESGIVAGNFSWYAFPFICLLAFVFAPRYLGANVMTLPEYIGKRFGETTGQYIAWYTIITILISWLGLTLFSGGVFMAQILGYPLWLCIVLLVIVAATFTIAGGLKTVAYINVYQMLLLITVSVFLAVTAVIKVGGIEAVVEQTPASYWKLLQPLNHPDFPWLAIALGYPIMGVWFWCTEQSMVQSVLGAKNLKQGQLGANFCAWLKIIDVPLFILPGILCFLLLPNLTNSTDAYLQLVKTILPSGMIGLVVVIMAAALIGSVASALNSVSTVYTMDIYLKNKRSDVSDKEINRIGRFITLFGAIFSIVLAIAITYIQGLSFFNIFQSVLSFLAPSMSVSFLFAVFWKKTSAKAINLTLTIGTLFSMVTGILYYTKVIFKELHFLYLSFLIFVLLSAFVIIFSLLDKTSSNNLLEYKPININNKVKIAWGLLIVIMIGLYIFFR